MLWFRRVASETTCGGRRDHNVGIVVGLKRAKCGQIIRQRHRIRPRNAADSFKTWVFAYSSAIGLLISFALWGKNFPRSDWSFINYSSSAKLDRRGHVRSSEPSVLFSVICRHFAIRHSLSSPVSFAVSSYPLPEVTHSQFGVLQYTEVGG